jgi:pilus assembly protein CpaE
MSAVVRFPEAHGDGDKDGKLSIAVISPDTASRDAAVTTLNECLEQTIHEFISYPSNLDDLVQTLGTGYEIVIVDMDSDQENAIDLVETICRNNLATVMMYSAHPDPEMLVRCMRAGVRELLNYPFNRESVRDAIQRVSSRRPVPVEKKVEYGQLHVFLSAKGGAGVTTLSSNFAVALAKESQKRTLLIDLCLPLGDAAINLGVRSQYSTASALQNQNRFDEVFLKQLLVQHNSGLFVLTAPTELDRIEVSGKAIDELVDVARREFDYVVIDAGSDLYLKGASLFAVTSNVYLVTQVGLPELRNANRLISLISATGGPKLEIVLNRFNSKKAELDQEHIEKALTRPVRWKIPNDYVAVRHMQNTATPLVTEDTPISRSIRQMARSVCGLGEIVEEKKGSSLLGWLGSRADRSKRTEGNEPPSDLQASKVIP